MKTVIDPSTDEKYRKLGFSEDGLCMKLRVGNVSVSAVGHPFKGVALIFESYLPRTICQYESSLPASCSLEKIAGLIYLNVVQNFRDSKDAWKVHFEKLGVALFQ